MAAESQVTIIILGKDQASGVLGALGKTAQQTGDKIEKSLGKSLQKAGKGITDMGKKMTLATAPLAVFAGVAVNSAVKAERLGKTLTGLAGGAQEAAKYIDAIKEASLGTIPKVDALAIANRSLSFGIVQTAEDMADLTKIAITLGRAQGLDASTAVRDFSTAIARSSPLILDNLGLTIKLTDAYRIYGESIGKTADELTAAEKKLAFQKAALIEGKKQVELMGGLQDDMAASAERLKAQMSDLAVEIGQQLIPVMQTGINIIGPVIQAFANLDEGTKQLIITFGIGAVAAGPLMMKLGMVTSTIGKLMDASGAGEKSLRGLFGAMGKAGVSTGLLGIAIAGLVTASKMLIDKISDINDEIQRSRDVVEGWSDEVDNGGLSIAEMASRAKDAAKVIDDMSFIQRESVKALGKEAELLETLNATQDEAREIAMSRAKSYEDFIKIIKRYNLLVDDSRLKVAEWTEAEYDAARGIGSWIDRLVALAKAKELVAQADSEDIRMGRHRVETMREQEKAERSFMDTVRTRVEAERTLREEESRGPTQEQVEAVKQRLADQEEAERTFKENVQKNWQETTAAYEEAKAARIAAINEQIDAQANLISSMKDVSAEQFKQQVFAMFDPKKMGLEAWAELGESFGLIDEEQVGLAQGATDLAAAIDAGAISLENAGPAADAFYQAIKNSNDVMPDYNDILGEVLDKFGTGEENIGPTADEMERTNTAMELMFDVAPPATEKLDAFIGSAGEGHEPVNTLREDVSKLNEGLDYASSKTWLITIRKQIIGDDASIPGQYQHGGVVPGPIGAPQLAIVHGGERVIPVGSSNMTQNSYGGDTYNTTVNNPLAAAILTQQQRQRRFDRMNRRM